MAATWQEVLMALGSWSLDLDYDPAVLAECVEGRTLRLYKGAELVYAGVLNNVLPSTDGITVSGHSLEWWLGIDAEGPLVTDSEFVVGNNKLSNPTFAFGDLFWRVGDASQWTIGTAATVAADPPDDDALESDEQFEALFGQEFAFTVSAHRASGSVGRLRPRLVFEGSYRPPNLLNDPTFTGAGWTDTSEFAGDAAVSGGIARIGPTSQKQLVLNNTFDSGLTDWTAFGGSWSVVSLASPVALHAVSVTDLGAALGQSVAVSPGETYRLSGYIYPHSGADGDAFLQVQLLGAGGGYVPSYQTGQKITTPQDTWTTDAFDINIADGTDHVEVFAVVENVTTAGYSFTGLWMLRTKGNTCSLISNDGFPVTPKRTYNGTFTVAIDAGLQSGTLKVIATYSTEGRDDIIEDLASLDGGGAGGTTKLLTFSLTPPSGYDLVGLMLQGVDVYGGSFNVTNGSIVDADDSTIVFDFVTPDTGSGDYTVTTTAPFGTDDVKAQVIAETQTGGWVVTAANLHRVTADPATSADVLDVVLTNEQSGHPTALAGSIESVPLLYDLHILNTVNRTLLKDLSRNGVVLPEREWRLNPDFTLDWGVAEALYEDRQDLVFTRRQLEVLDLPSQEVVGENRVTRVKVIGADRNRAAGGTTPITGEAEIAAPGVLDQFGNSLDRTRVVTDSTVNHPDFAANFAGYQASLPSNTNDAVTLKLSDLAAIGRWFFVGDWVYPYEPSAGLEDKTNGQIAADGSYVFPKKSRVLERTVHLGDGWSAEIRRPDGTTFPLSGVRWEAATTMEISVGALLPEYVADPAGGAPIDQFKRFITSRTR